MVLAPDNPGAFQSRPSLSGQSPSRTQQLFPVSCPVSSTKRAKLPRVTSVRIIQKSLISTSCNGRSSTWQLPVMSPMRNRPGGIHTGSSGNGVLMTQCCHSAGAVHKPMSRSREGGGLSRPGRSRSPCRLAHPLLIDDFKVLRIYAKPVSTALPDDCAIRNGCNKGGVTCAVCALHFVSTGLSHHHSPVTGIRNLSPP